MNELLVTNTSHIGARFVSAFQEIQLDLYIQAFSVHLLTTMVSLD